MREPANRVCRHGSNFAGRKREKEEEKEKEWEKEKERRRKEEKNPKDLE